MFTFVTIEPERVQPLLDRPVEAGDAVVYLMQASQRVSDNLALAYAISAADELDVPLLVVFALTETYPDARYRHYHFMLEGLVRVRNELAERGIGMAARIGSPAEAVGALKVVPRMVVTDAGYLREQRLWRRDLIRKVTCRVMQIEDNVVVPVRLVSHKEEYAAYTIRRKLAKHRSRFLAADAPVLPEGPRRGSLDMDAFGDARVPLEDGADAVGGPLDVDRSVGRTSYFSGGTSEAERHLHCFVQDGLDHYHSSRSDPSLHIQSNMSPYLHFGQISPRVIAATVSRADAPKEAIEAYLEELIVRRELSMNFVYYNPAYRSYGALPGWALETLDDHRDDQREHLYDRGELEQGRTGDPYWNAAMREMRVTGKMHNYMRMYWGKRFLQWHRAPEEAFETALYLNNKYFLDGRDANSFAGVAWCFGKHDRPWQERPVFGKVRYMNANGLRRKFDIDEYVRWTEALEETT